MPQYTWMNGCTVASSIRLSMVALTVVASLSMGSSLSARSEFQLVLPRLRPYQEAFLEEASRVRESICVSAMQIGKTRMGAKYLLSLAWQNPGSLFWWCAPVGHQARPGFDEIDSLARPRGILTRVSAAGSASGPPSHYFVNGSRIEYRSWEREQNMSGPAVKGLVIDEGQLLTPRAEAQASGRLSSTLGSMLILGNASYETGQFWRMCERARLREGGGVFFQRWPWRMYADCLDGEAKTRYLAFLEHERQRRGAEEFARRYEAQFLHLGTGILDLARVAVNGGNAIEPMPLPFFEEWNGVEPCIAGLDLGDKQSYTVLSVMGTESGRLLAMDRFNHMPWEAQVARVMDTLKRYCRKTNHDTKKRGQEVVVYADATMLGAPVLQMLDSAGADSPVEFFPVVFDNKKKIQMVQWLQAATEGRWLTMPYIEEAIEEAQMLERVTLANTVTYRGAAGAHDDIVFSLGLIGWGMEHVITVAA